MRFMVKLLLWVLLIAALASAAGLFRFWLFLNLPGTPRRTHSTVTISRGMNVATIANRLARKGIISDPYLFRILCRRRAVEHELRAGEYRLSSLLTPDQVIDRLKRGRVIEYRVTFPEGSTIRDVARIVAKSRLASAQAVLRLARDPAFARSLGIDAPGLEGYLFPETYLFPKSVQPQAILREMVHQFRIHVGKDAASRARQMGLTLHQVVTLASMVEKEAQVNKERPLIAAVFLNRLKIDMPLQSDPTAVYDLAGFQGPVTAKHLDRDSPYNTYRHKGLPIGPICNPGLRSIEAVLHPADVTYLYFVSNRNGTHTFSNTYSEHVRAVRKRRNLSKTTNPSGKRNP